MRQALPHANPPSSCQTGFEHLRWTKHEVVLEFEQQVPRIELDSWNRLILQPTDVRALDTEAPSHIFSSQRQILKDSTLLAVINGQVDQLVVKLLR